MKKYFTLIFAVLVFSRAMCQTFELIDTNLADNAGVMIGYNDQLYYDGSDPAHGIELWISDGTPGAHMLKDINTTGNSNPHGEFIYNGKLYFQATDSTAVNGLWVTDGTAGGTQLVKYLPGGGTGFMTYNGKMYFANTSGNYALWTSDGTPAGTNVVKQVLVNSTPFLQGAGSIVIYNGKMYFSGTDSAHGAELWVSDGTDTGTHLLYDIFPGTNGSSPFNLISFKNKLFFGAGTSIAFGARPTLFVYTGDTLVNLPDTTTNCDTFFIFNDQLYILALNGDGQNLWITDGTGVGTTQVSNTAGGNGATSRMQVLGNKMFYISNDHNFNFVPWISDGTIAGTVCLDDSFSDCGGTFAMEYNGSIYFSADLALASSDGTPQGTRRQTWNDTMFNLYTTIHFAQTSTGLFFNAAHRTGTSFNDIWKLTTPKPTALANVPQNLPEINVYPNPSNGSFQLQTTGTGRLQISVYDLAGRLLMQSVVTTRGTCCTNVNLSNAASGIYLLQVKSATGTQCRKIEVY